MRSQSIAAAILLALLLSACSDSEPPGPLTIGLHDETNDTFIPLADDDPVPVVLGANGLNMIVPSLRAEGVDPSGPEPDVTVNVGGVVMAAVIQGDNADMTADGEGYILWDLRVPFQTELCCYNCSDAIVFARLEDRSGHAFEGEVNVVMSRNGTCPDTSVCCADANDCPDPTLATVCE